MEEKSFPSPRQSGLRPIPAERYRVSVFHNSIASTKPFLNQRGRSFSMLQAVQCFGNRFATS